MSSQDVEIVQRAHDALNRGDMDALVGLCDAGFRLDMSDRIFNPAVYEGHEGIRRFYSEVRDVWASYVWQPEEIIEAGENIVALLRSTGRGRGSGVEVERDTAMLWSLSGGRQQWRSASSGNKTRLSEQRPFPELTPPAPPING